MIEFITLISVHRLAANGERDDERLHAIAPENTNTIFSNLPFFGRKTAVANLRMCESTRCDKMPTHPAESTGVVLFLVSRVFYFPFCQSVMYALYILRRRCWIAKLAQDETGRWRNRELTRVQNTFRIDWVRPVPVCTWRRRKNGGARKRINGKEKANHFDDSLCVSMVDAEVGGERPTMYVRPDKKKEHARNEPHLVARIKSRAAHH